MAEQHRSKSVRRIRWPKSRVSESARPSQTPNRVGIRELTQNKHLSPAERDAIALGADWQRVGDDISVALFKLEEPGIERR